MSAARAKCPNEFVLPLLFIDNWIWSSTLVLTKRALHYIEFTKLQNIPSPDRNIFKTVTFQLMLKYIGINTNNNDNNKKKNFIGVS